MPKQQCKCTGITSGNLQVEIYEDFIIDCINRLKAMFDTISALERNNDNMACINQEAQRMIRVLTILRVYIADCDEAYTDERAILPLYRQVATTAVNLSHY